MAHCALLRSSILRHLTADIIDVQYRLRPLVPAPVPELRDPPAHGWACVPHLHGGGRSPPLRPLSPSQLRSPTSPGAGGVVPPMCARVLPGLESFERCERSKCFATSPTRCVALCRRGDNALSSALDASRVLRFNRKMHAHKRGERRT